MRYEVVEHENGKEFFVRQIETGYKIGFGALSFRDYYQADSLRVNLETAYIEGKRDGTIEMTEALKKIADGNCN